MRFSPDTASHCGLLHAVAEHLPAVCGSSGRLVIYGLRPSAGDGRGTWRGQVFDDPESAYAAAMQEFVRRSAPRAPGRSSRPQQPEEPATSAADRLMRQQRRHRRLRREAD